MTRTATKTTNHTANLLGRAGRAAARELARTPEGGWPETMQAVGRYEDAVVTWKWQGGAYRNVLRVSIERALAWVRETDGIDAMHPSRR